MIKVDDIRKSFGEVEVLRGVSLTVGRGEVVSIVGASGAGKTTLLQIMGTLLTPDGGAVEIDGRTASGMNDRQLSKFRNEKIGFVFQFHHLLPEFDARENVMMPALIGGVPRREADRRARTLLETVGLADRMHHKPAALSGGEQQRGHSPCAGQLARRGSGRRALGQSRFGHARRGKQALFRSAREIRADIRHSNPR